jgi:hypothetical protein
MSQKDNRLEHDENTWSRWLAKHYPNPAASTDYLGGSSKRSKKVSKGGRKTKSKKNKRRSKSRKTKKSVFHRKRKGGASPRNITNPPPEPPHSNPQTDQEKIENYIFYQTLKWNPHLL